MKLILILFLLSISNSLLAKLPIATTCKIEIEKTLKDWGSIDEWETRGDSIYYSPTDTFGNWIFLAKDLQNEKISKANENNEIQVVFDKNCTREIKTLTKKVNTIDAVNDKILRSKIETMKNGLIFIWSRQMPLSLKAIPEIIKAAKEQKLELILLTDKKSIASLDSNKNLDKSLVNNSFELMMRNGSLHFPAVYAFKKGQIINKVKYGYENKEGYIEDIKNIFDL